MSDRLAVSAAFSVLMMAAFVLFGPGAAQVEFTPESLRAQYALVSSAAVSAAGTSFISVK